MSIIYEAEFFYSIKSKIVRNDINIELVNKIDNLIKNFNCFKNPREYERKNSIYNLINNPLVYKMVQKIMSGTSFRANIIKKNIKKKKFKNIGYWMWSSRGIRNLTPV